MPVLHRTLTLAALLATLTACASAPTTTKPTEHTVSPEEQAIADEAAAKAADFKERQELPRLMLDLQSGLQRYFEMVYASGPPRIEENKEKLARFLQETVERNYDVLDKVAHNVDTPRNQAIALGALGFCINKNHPAVLDTLRNGVRSDDADVSHHAVLGLAVLRDKRTPPSTFAAVIRDTSRRAEDRSTAAWALYQLQLQTVDDKLTPIVAVWLEILEGELDEEPDEVVITAVRGLGQTRDAGHREVVERYIAHPTALVRMAAAIALGRMRSDASAPALLKLLGPAESNENVRLAARKALQELAPGIDRGYDVDEWRKVFERN